MKRYVSFLVLLMTAISLQAQDFQQFFNDSTLRLDYIFAGDKKSQHIYLAQLHKSAGWYGRRHHLDQLPLEGNGSLLAKHGRPVGHLKTYASFPTPAKL